MHRTVSAPSNNGCTIKYTTQDHAPTELYKFQFYDSDTEAHQKQLPHSPRKYRRTGPCSNCHVTTNWDHKGWSGNQDNQSNWKLSWCKKCCQQRRKKQKIAKGAATALPPMVAKDNDEFEPEGIKRVRILTWCDTEKERLTDAGIKRDLPPRPFKRAHGLIWSDAQKERLRTLLLNKSTSRPPIFPKCCRARRSGKECRISSWSPKTSRGQQFRVK